jgi:monoterpene epsilon-lactone hydrolase
MGSKQADLLKTFYRGLVAAMESNPEMPLDEMRRLFEHWGDVTGEPGGVDYIETDATGIPALWARPHHCREDRVLLCAHGGGYVTASMYTHRKVYAHVAKAVGCRALIAHYRRAPESIHPGPVNDMATCYRWLLDQGIAPQHIALIGDSAGGALAVTTMLRARELGQPLPAASMPLSPWLDMDARGKAFDTNRERDVLVTRDVIGVMAATFLGEGGNRNDPLANPLQGDLRGLPPLYIQTGADETLLTDSEDLAALARRSGVDVTLEVVPEMQHVFQILAGIAPEADAAIARLANWVRPHLGIQ